MIETIVAAILNWLLSKLIDWGIIQKKFSDDDKLAKEDAERLKNAKDAKDKEDAAKNINDHLFS